MKGLLCWKLWYKSPKKMRTAFERHINLLALKTHFKNTLKRDNYLNFSFHSLQKIEWHFQCTNFAVPMSAFGCLRSFYKYVLVLLLLKCSWCEENEMTENETRDRHLAFLTVTLSCEYVAATHMHSLHINTQIRYNIWSSAPFERSK